VCTLVSVVRKQSQSGQASEKSFMENIVKQGRKMNKMEKVEK
jgi:hypothetical protein